MKRLLILFGLFFFALNPIWASGAANDAAAAIPTGGDAPFLSTPDWAQGDGGCQLPDLAGLSDAEAQAEIEAAGLRVTNAAAPACPVAFSCDSITNCTAGNLCSTISIGRCCTMGGGLGLCCATGVIKVRTCPCRCTSNLCSFSCLNSNDIKWGCS